MTAAIAARARAVAGSPTPIRERLAQLIELAAEARRIDDPRERRVAELAVYQAAVPVLEEVERPIRPVAVIDEPLPDDDLAREVRRAAARRARREALLPTATEVPVPGPRWASRVLDLGDEIVGVHARTGTPYPLALFRDLDIEDSAIVVAGRVLAAGGTVAEVRRLLGALGLEGRVRRPLERALGEGVG